jgi:opacity protein-like surface antigen
MQWIKVAVIKVAVVAMGVSAMSAAAGAQASAVKSISQTDVSLSLYGAFAGTTTGDGIQQSPSNAAGVMIAVRHIDNPLVGYEGTYSVNRANQVYSLYPDNLPCIVTGCPTAPVSADAHEISGDWVASLKLANLRPFALAGAGLVFNEPSSGQTDTHSSTKGVFLYGLGLDWGLLPHIGLRFQYRGNVYRTPDLTNALGSSGAFLHTAEPMIGAYFRF